MKKRVYRYRCAKCNYEWTVNADAYRIRCPNCGESDHVLMVSSEEVDE